MIKKHSKLLLPLLAAVLIVGAVYFTRTETARSVFFPDVFAAEVIESGECGENLTWTFDDEYTLTISGTGAMANYSSVDALPWYLHRDNIEKVIIGDSVNSIGESAFYGCVNLTDIYIPKNIEFFGNSAFFGCDNLSRIYFDGTEEEWNMISIDSSNSAILAADVHWNHIHENNVWLTIAEAGAHTTGLKTSTCEVCHYVIQEIIPITHTEIQTDLISATCTTVGYTAGVYCNDCKTYMSGHEEIPALGHIDGEWFVERESNCTAGGKEVLYCIRGKSDSSYVQSVRIPYFEEIDNSAFMQKITSCATTWLDASRAGEVKYGTLSLDKKDYMAERLNPMLYATREGGAFTNSYRDIWTAINNGTKDSDGKGKTVNCITLCNMIVMGVPYEGSRLNGHENVIGMSGYAFDVCKLLDASIDSERNATYNPDKKLDINTFERILTIASFFDTYEKLGLTKTIKTTKTGTDGEIWYDEIRPGDVLWTGSHSLFCLSVTVDSGNVTITGIDATTVKNISDYSFTVKEDGTLSGINKSIKKVARPYYSDYTVDTGYVCDRVLARELPVNTENHSWDSGKITTSATCKENGIITYTCEYNSDHKKTESIEVNPSAHEYTNNCDKSCNLCGANRTITHDYKPATCTEPMICKVCGATSGNNIDHSYTADVTTAATCIETGINTFTCSCGASYTEIIAKTDHSYSTSYTVDKNASCTEEGSMSRYCTTSGCTEKTDVTVIEKTAHLEVSVVGIASTCTSEGLSDGKKCSVCGTITVAQQIIAKAPHSYTANVTKAATCIETGINTFTCSCGDFYTETIAKTDHSYSNSYTVDETASCTKEGSKSRHCTTNGCAEKTDVTEIAIIAHTEVTIDGKAATCTETGLTDGKKCSVCEEVILAQQTIEKTAHTEATIVGEAETCSKTGLTEGKKCSVCGTITLAQQTIAKKAHTYDNACDKSCNVCKATRKITHNYAAATCTKAKTCKVCKATTGKANGHKYTNACDKSCNVCKATRTIKHTYKTVTTKATLTKNGKVETKCSVCGYVSKTTTVYYPKTIKLSKTEYTYNGKVQTPSVTVKDSKGNTLKKDTDYTVSYESGRKLPGKYTVTITFKGKYSGTKKLTYTIAPRVTTKITASQTVTTITLKWNKVTGADGYRIYQYNTKTKKYEKVKDVTSTSLKLTSLKSGTKYKFKVRAFTKDDGTIMGAYSPVFETATKAKTPTLKATSTKKGTTALSWTNVTGESGYQVYYATKKNGEFKKLSSYKVNVVKGSKSKLTSGKTYYFKVRAYTKTDSGTVYSAWSTVKSIKVK